MNEEGRPFDSGEFWIAIWKIIAAALVGLVTVLGGCQVSQSLIARDMVLNGANPVDAACATGSISIDAAKACMLRMAK